MLKNQKKMGVLKAVAVGLSAYIVKAMFVSVLLMAGVKDTFAVNTLSNIAVIAASGFYYNYCVQPLGNRVRAFDDKKFPLHVVFSAASIAIMATILAGWFIYGGAFSGNEIVTESVETLRNNPVFDATLDESTPQIFQVYLLYYFCSICISPVAEEIIYRGFFFRHLYAINRPAAYWVTVVFFTASHGNIVEIIAAGFGAVLYSLVYVKTKSLRMAILTHMLYNIFALFMSLLSGVIPLFWAYNALGFSVVATVAVGSLIMLKRCKISTREIPRPRKYTPEEQEKTRLERLEMDEIFNKYESEKREKRRKNDVDFRGDL